VKFNMTAMIVAATVMATPFSAFAKHSIKPTSGTYKGAWQDNTILTTVKLGNKIVVSGDKITFTIDGKKKTVNGTVSNGLNYTKGNYQLNLVPANKNEIYAIFTDVSSPINSNVATMTRR
jgi:hypothetical protein